MDGIAQVIDALAGNGGGFLLSGMNSVHHNYRMMRCCVRALAAVVAITASLHGAPARAADLFAMSFEDFRKAFDQRIREDTIDKSEANFSTTKQCTKKGTTYDCTFNDKGFQSTVTGFKKLDFMSGRFTLKLALTVQTGIM